MNLTPDVFVACSYIVVTMFHQACVLPRVTGIEFWSFSTSFLAMIILATFGLILIFDPRRE